MMAAHRAYCALSGLDPACASFIEAYGDKKNLCFGLCDPGDSLKAAVTGASSGSIKGNGALDSHASAGDAAGATTDGNVSPAGSGKTDGPSASLFSAVLGGMASRIL